MREFIELQVKMYKAGIRKIPREKLLLLIDRFYGEGSEELHLEVIQCFTI